MKSYLRSSRTRGAAILLGAVVVLTLAACGGSVDAPAADLSEEITGGNGVFIGSAWAAGAPSGYVQNEYVATGTATAYQVQDFLGDDGRWSFAPTTTAPYRTRVLVRRPTDPAAFSGTIIVEWLNVSGGVDADPDFGSLVEEITRQGHIWVGVSAQLVGIEGGPVLVQVAGGGAFAGLGLKAIDPARYASLSHPGDGYSFDIFTQVARALRAGGGVLGGSRPTVVLAAGESQSAFALTTYYNGVQPLTHAFDGFFVHSRGSTTLPLVEPGQSADLGTALFAPEHPVLRDDLAVPVMELQAESDATGLLSSALVRQPDSDVFRLWEVAGTAHADLHLLGAAASGIDCGVAINNGPMHVVAKAAFRGLETWVRTGTAPPSAPRLELDPNNPVPVVLRDADGIALGGVRTPPVDVPVDVLSGAASATGGLVCILLGSTTPLTDPRIAALYASRTVYQQQYASSADAAILAGYVLADDRDALLAFSQPLRVLP